MDDIDQVRSCFDDCAAREVSRRADGQRRLQQRGRSDLRARRWAFRLLVAVRPVRGRRRPGEWDARKADYTERVLGVWREYASNLDDENVRAKFLFTPLDVERLNVNMVRGAVRMGAYIPSQLGINRPHPLLSGTRTPDRRALSVRVLDRQRRRHQRCARLYRRQRDCRRPQARTSVDARAGARVAPLTADREPPAARRPPPAAIEPSAALFEASSRGDQGLGYSSDVMARSNWKRIAPSLLLSAITKRTRPWFAVST